MNIQKQHWIRADFAAGGNVCPVFRKVITISRPLAGATLEITAKGVYEAEIDGKRVGNFIFAPGYTVYKTRHQVQTYDITELLSVGENTLDVTVAEGWYHGRIHGVAHGLPWEADLIAQITLTYADGTKELLGTDESWLVGKGPIVFSDIYDGEIYDARVEKHDFVPVSMQNDASTAMLIPQEGEPIIEQEHIRPVRVITTPKGETVIDFGQNLTGYPSVILSAKAGEKLALSFAEILDKDGNFYNENYRSARCRYEYTCTDGMQTYKPHLTFYGFRYVRVDAFPASCALEDADFTAIAVYSAIRKTGELNSDHPKLNQLFSNIFWGQRCNFLDIPTDCPQRDERQGWTGDAQVFVKTASYNFDVERFFRKWMGDVAAEVKENGTPGFVVPDSWGDRRTAEAWTDAAVIVPWQIYQTYGDKALLAEQLESMSAYVDHVFSEKEYKQHFGDWLGLDAKVGSYVGATRFELISCAYLAHDCELLAKAEEALGKDSSKSRARFEMLRTYFREHFSELKTQTEHVLALHFDLAEDKAAVAASLANLIHECGDHLTTGFVGTPYLLHALSDNGYTELAYSLLLREEFPSWLFSVGRGATTMWEHWDGVNEAGEVWSKDMNSFNHYAYGAVADWVYEKAAGIRVVENAPGFEKVVIAPQPDARIGRLSASIDTRHGKVSSLWYHTDGRVRYEITVPVAAEIRIDGKTYNVEKGTYLF